jgi:uncharacterized protein involved in exopolysaccharide biosynthesis
MKGAPVTKSDQEAYLFEFWGDLWRGRWVLVGASGGLGLVAAIVVLMLPSWFQADVLMMPSEERKAMNLAGSIGGLASLAGISVGGGDATEAIAVLKSRDFTRAFIEDQNLLPVLFASEFDETANAWRMSDPEDQPDIRDGIRYFDRKVRSVTEERRTKLVTLSIEWKDAELAARWADSLVKRLNERMRQRALLEATANIAYLRGELLREDTTVEMQRSIGRLLEAEMQKLMLARGNDDFAFRVIDRAQIPKRRSKPARFLIVSAASLFGGALAALFVVLRAIRQRQL